MHKKALIITYYWPPAGGPGVQRWLKFVKYFQRFQINPIVYIPENPNYPITDNSLLPEIPDGITILKQPIKEPYRFAKLLSKKNSNTISKGIISDKKKQSIIERVLLYIRGNYFIPDARKSWIKPSVDYLTDYIEMNQISTIITTGPPHSLHLIGLHLKQKLNLKWFADFRDPWTTIGYHKKLKLTKTSREKHKTLETKVLQTADEIIVTSFKTKIEFSTITKQPISVITNGYDKETFERLELDEVFSIAHIGSLLSERNPDILWCALNELISENEMFKEQFQLELVGAVSQDVSNSISSYGLSDYVNYIGYVSHQKALQYQHKSQVLLLIEIDSEDTKCIIPGKLFEYMITNRPIIAIGPTDSDVSQIIKTTNTGNYFGYSDYDVLKQTILNHFEAFQSNNLKTNPIGLEQYSRIELTKKLSELLHS